MAQRTLLYRLYERRLERQLAGASLPCHIGVILDGNRRYAHERGEHASVGHAAGAERIPEFLGWCDELGIAYVTLWLLSTDNLGRDDDELEPLLRIIGRTVSRLARMPEGPRISAVGALDQLPDDVRRRLKEAEEATASHPGVHVQVAVGYGGRQEIVDALRSLLLDAAARDVDLAELAEQVTTEDLTRHLYGPGLPDPDLIIRTSGEVRMSGFLLWQSVHSEFHFADPYWPAFRRVDFLRALRDYQARTRRFGG